MYSLVSEWAHWQGIYLLQYPDNWLIITDSVPHVLEPWELLLSLCKDLGIVINGEKSDLKPTSKAQYNGMLIDTIQERVYLTDYWIIRFQDGG